jgi:hypothetical protein
MCSTHQRFFQAAGMDPYGLKLTILALTSSPEMPILGHRQGEPNRKQKRSWLKGLVAEMREGLPQPGPVCKSRRGRQWAEAPRGSKVHCKQDDWVHAVREFVTDCCLPAAGVRAVRESGPTSRQPKGLGIPTIAWVWQSSVVAGVFNPPTTRRLASSPLYPFSNGDVWRSVPPSGRRPGRAAIQPKPYGAFAI